MTTHASTKWSTPWRFFADPALVSTHATMGLVIAGSLTLALIVLATNGSILFGLIFLGGMTVLLGTLYRLDWGVYLFIGIVLICDQYHIPGFDPLTLKVSYYQNIKEIPFLPYVSAAVMNPLEAHFALLVLVWFVLLCVKRKISFNHTPVWGALLLFLMAVIGAFVYGMQRGGDFLPAVWEVRALFYLALLYFFIPQIIRTRAQIQTLMGVCIAAITFKALQGIARFVGLGFSFQGYPTLTNHEDPVFILTLFVLFGGLMLYRSAHHHRWILLGLSLPLFLGFFVAQRRAAYAAIATSLAVFFILPSSQERWTLFKIFCPIILVTGVYCAAFWNSESRLAMPIRLIKSGVADDRETAGDRYYSNLYREFENYNLAVTVRHNPVLGIGFGNKYEMPIPLVNIAFPLRDYIPHNEILWLLAKMGGLGFFLFWLFLDGFMYRGASIFTGIEDPYLKAVCIMIIAAVANQMVVSYFDLQLTYYRNMVYLGTLMGLLPVMENLGRPAAVPSRTAV